MKYIVMASLMTLIIACNPDKNKPVDLKQITFQTTDASEMYFKNIRQSNYSLEELKQAGINAYTSPELNQSKMILKPILILNWRNDKAYIIFQDISEEKLSLRFGSDTTTYQLDPGHHQDQAEMAIRMYNAILSGQTIQIKQEDQTFEEILSDAGSRESFRVIVMDFLRLVEIR